MGVDYFYCSSCCECLHEGLFLHCDMCDDMIGHESSEYDCIIHKKSHQAIYKNCKLVLCKNCSYECEYVQKDPKEILKIIDHLDHLAESVGEKIEIKKKKIPKKKRKESK